MDKRAQDTEINIDNYDFAQTSIMSLGTGVKYEDPKFHLILVQKKELPSERPIIQSTKMERLAFYRAYTSSDSKVSLTGEDQVGMNNFLWTYAFNVFFKSLPHGFVHFFIAAYAPEEHLFVAKMVPFCYGIKYLLIIVGFVEMLIFADTMCLMLSYICDGLMRKNPWNRCIARAYFDDLLNSTIHCYEVEEFAQQFANRSHPFLDYTYINERNEHFQVAQVEYYRLTTTAIMEYWNVTLFIFVWGAIQLLVLRSRDRNFWKLLHFTQWGINLLDLVCFLYLILMNYEKASRDRLYVNPRASQDENTDEANWSIDLEILAESITAPSVVHVLTSRSTQEIDPTKDSSVMIVSNALIYIFRGLLGFQLKAHCEEMANTKIPNIKFNHHNWFYFWPMYWHQFYLGDIFTLLYFSFNFMTEMIIIAVIYLCVTETVVYEWPKVKRWMVMLVVSTVGLLSYRFTGVDSRAIMWAYGKGIATLAETVFIYIIYPIARLVDDFTFHYGIPPTQLRILSIRFVPVYYIVKSYIMFTGLWDLIATTEVSQDVPHYVWSWSLFLIPILLGMLYIIYKYLIIHRATWNYILRPIPKWGPRDFSVRQLRKQFDSRYYISSEVPRLLSRFLLSKRDANVYKVDVRYDVQRRSTVSKAVGFGGFRADEKKEI